MEGPGEEAQKRPMRQFRWRGGSALSREEHERESSLRSFHDDISQRQRRRLLRARAPAAVERGPKGGEGSELPDQTVAGPQSGGEAAGPGDLSDVPVQVDLSVLRLPEELRGAASDLAQYRSDRLRSGAASPRAAAPQGGAFARPSGEYALPKWLQKREASDSGGGFTPLRQVGMAWAAREYRTNPPRRAGATPAFLKDPSKGAAAAFDWWTSVVEKCSFEEARHNRLLFEEDLERHAPLPEPGVPLLRDPRRLYADGISAARPRQQRLYAFPEAKAVRDMCDRAAEERRRAEDAASEEEVLLASMDGAPEAQAKIVAAAHLRSAARALRAAPADLSGIFGPFGVAESPFGVAESPFGVAESPSGVAESPSGVAESPVGSAASPPTSPPAAAAARERAALRIQSLARGRRDRRRSSSLRRARDAGESGRRALERSAATTLQRHARGRLSRRRSGALREARRRAAAAAAPREAVEELTPLDAFFDERRRRAAEKGAAPRGAPGRGRPAAAAAVGGAEAAPVWSPWGNKAYGGWGRAASGAILVDVDALQAAGPAAARAVRVDVLSRVALSEEAVRAACGAEDAEEPGGAEAAIDVQPSGEVGARGAESDVDAFLSEEALKLPPRGDALGRFDLLQRAADAIGAQLDEHALDMRQAFDAAELQLKVLRAEAEQRRKAAAERVRRLQGDAAAPARPESAPPRADAGESGAALGEAAQAELQRARRVLERVEGMVGGRGRKRARRRSAQSTRMRM